METAILIVLLGLAAVLGARLSRLWFTWRGERMVTCPETHKPVGVKLDVKHVALTGIGHAPGLRLSTCTRWPERQDCGQECLSTPFEKFANVFSPDVAQTLLSAAPRLVSALFVGAQQGSRRVSTRQARVPAPHRHTRPYL